MAKNDSPRVAAQEQTPATPEDPPVIDSKNLLIRDGESDYAFAKEVKQSYVLEKGAQVNLRGFNGKLEVLGPDHDPDSHETY